LVSLGIDGIATPLAVSHPSVTAGITFVWTQPEANAREALKAAGAGAEGFVLKVFEAGRVVGCKAALIIPVAAYATWRFGPSLSDDVALFIPRLKNFSGSDGEFAPVSGRSR
jgi:hypothetical protein